jgi:hypothetical protein
VFVAVNSINLAVRGLDGERKRVIVRQVKGGQAQVIPIIDDEYLSDLLILISSRKENGADFSQ